MRLLLLLGALLCATAAQAHTPVCRCQLEAQQISCQGGYDDGSSADGIAMRVLAYSGETLADGVLDTRSRFSTPLPGQPFYILMDAGPGEMFEIDWRDVAGIDQQHFEVTSTTF
ncbi:hypothetical protein [Pseudomonas abyssi]|uniref:Uncharacterized protein n=1 Tax=Pseudomonas abyssi TaxID=170540 RepID=A0A395R7K9_9PSED|nr:hypothetical protein [Halopseudomonas gallaeciensis]RGP56107.1 hypothetical protein ASB58_01640 [Halopseudomonas gallaeciensis]